MGDQASRDVVAMAHAARWPERARHGDELVVDLPLAAPWRGSRAIRIGRDVRPDQCQVIVHDHLHRYCEGTGPITSERKRRFHCTMVSPARQPRSSHVEDGKATPSSHRHDPRGVVSSASMARLLSLCVGLPRDIEWRGRTVHTGIWKEAVQDRRRVRRLNIDGDGQGDLGGHGGEQRAVFVYQAESYRYWEQRLGRSDFTHGQFGENFTVEGLPDDEVCIGDRYRVGTALFEVSQPRVTCYRVGIRTNEPQMAALLTSSGRPGFYLRVIEEGDVGAGDAIVPVARGPEGMTVAEVNALLYTGRHPRDQLLRALRIPALSPGWRGSFEALVRSQEANPGASGNAGLMPAAVARTAAPGFRPLRVAAVVRECADVISLSLEPSDGVRLTAPLAGQFVVLRLQPTPGAALVFRSYSLSGPSSGDRYRISVKDRAARYGGELPGRQRAARRAPRCQRTQGRLHLASRGRPRGPAQRGHRRDAGAGHAARAGGRCVGARDLVAAQCTQWQVARLRRGGAATCRGTGARAKPRLVQPARCGRPGRDGTTTRQGVLQSRRSTGCAFRERATSISAGRRAFSAR
jgi:MOSC domain-containing protein YiiM